MNARLQQARLSRRGLLTASAGASLLVSGLTPAPRRVARAQDATPKAGGTYRLLGSGDIRSMDPGGAEGSEDWWSSGSLVFNRLYAYDAENTFFADLAADFPTVSEDGLLYTIPLLEGVKFHNGREMTADDVAFSLAWQLWPEVYSWGKTYMENVVGYDEVIAGDSKELSGIKVIDPYTLEVTLKTPQAVFPAILSMTMNGISPKQEVIDAGEEWGKSVVIGTGPFKFARWEKGNFIQLDKNENYWRPGRPYLDRLIIRFIADSATRAAGVERGEIDVATFGTINPVEMRRLERLPHIAIAKGGYEAIAPVMMLELNVQKPPFDDKRVRLAVAYALDRNFITRAIWHGFGKPAVGPISSFMKGNGAFTDQNILRFDVRDRLEIANRLLDEAGLKRGTNGMRVKIFHDPAPFGEDWRRMGEYIKQALARVGIDVELRNRDYPSFVRLVHNEYDFNMTSTWSIGMADPTLGVQRQTWSKTINRAVPFGNVSQYRNPEVDKLWEAAQTEIDPAKRNQIFHKLQELLVADSPIIWLMEMDLVAVQNKRVKDLITSPLGLRGGLYETWIQR